MKGENLNTGSTHVDDQTDFVDEVESFDPIEDDVERLRDELRSERDQFLSLAAEYDNYRRPSTTRALGSGGER